MIKNNVTNIIEILIPQMTTPGNKKNDNRHNDNNDR